MITPYEILANEEKKIRKSNCNLTAYKSAMDGGWDSTEDESQTTCIAMWWFSLEISNCSQSAEF